MADQLSAKFAALADPTRRAMLARLAKGQASVSEIAEPFLKRMSLPAVTKHIKVLEQAGLVSKTSDAQRRLCDLNPQGLKETVDYLEQYRQQWEETLDRFGAYLNTLAPKTAPTKDPKPKPSPTKRNRKKANGNS